MYCKYEDSPRPVANDVTTTPSMDNHCFVLKATIRKPDVKKQIHIITLMLQTKTMHIYIQKIFLYIITV